MKKATLIILLFFGALESSAQSSNPWYLDLNYRHATRFAFNHEGGIERPGISFGFSCGIKKLPNKNFGLGVRLNYSEFYSLEELVILPDSTRFLLEIPPSRVNFITDIRFDKLFGGKRDSTWFASISLGLGAQYQIDPSYLLVSFYYFFPNVTEVSGNNWALLTTASSMFGIRVAKSTYFGVNLETMLSGPYRHPVPHLYPSYKPYEISLYYGFILYSYFSL